MPVQVALSWELRADLRAHFRLETADDLYRFLAWALTSGVREGVVKLSGVFSAIPAADGA